MVEYSFLLGNNIRNAWSGQILPLIDTLIHSSYFWPGVVAVAIVIALLVRLIGK